MTTITVTLSEERMARLKQVAEELHLSPEDLARASIEDILNQMSDDFARAAEYVLKKNAELYRRLA